MNRISHKKLINVLDYDPLTGIFTWKKSIRSGFINKNAGHLHTSGYIKIIIYGRMYRAQRLAWFYFYKKWPNRIIDHKNGDKTDNRIKNLRDITQTENNQNKKKIDIRNKSGYPGVFYNEKSKKWRASIGIDCKTYRIGEYLTKEEAREEYLKQKEILHPISSIKYDITKNITN